MTSKVLWGFGFDFYTSHYTPNIITQVQVYSILLKKSNNDTSPDHSGAIQLSWQCFVYVIFIECQKFWMWISLQKKANNINGCPWIEIFTLLKSKLHTYRGILDLVGTEYLCNMISKPSQLSSISNTPSCLFQFLFDFIVIPYGLVLVQAIRPLFGLVLFDSLF
mgnify:CR=1 FL=1